MKLKRLYIQRYKNLVDLNIDFAKGNGLTIIVGNNGSGKSNLLEVISGIFHDLYKGKTSRKIKSDYSLDYEFNDIGCKLEQRDGTLRCYGPKRMSVGRFVKSYAPNNVIGLYSGEEDRLWTQFYAPYYKTYIQQIRLHRDQDYMRLMFINKYYWNLALLTLLLSDNETLTPFIENDIGIKSVSKVELSFNYKYYDDVNESLIKFIDRINPDRVARKEYSIIDLKGLVSQVVPREDKSEDTIIDDRRILGNFVQACMPKYTKIITEIKIGINDNLTVKQLSEGEKKLILVKTVLEILSDEKSLVLMDEPDAHLHEGRKSALIDMMREYQNRQIVVATHSPIIAELANDNELIMLEVVAGQSALLAEEKREKIKHLIGNAWDIIGHEMIFKSKRPLVIFEGKTDVLFVKRALELLKKDHPDLTVINADFLNANGAGNVKSFIDNLLELVAKEKKIFVFFDRDDAGRKGAAAVAGISKDDEKVVHYRDVTKGNVTVSFIPYRDGITDGDFLIEDYFSWDGTLKDIFDELIPEQKHPIKNLPNLPTRIKCEIESRIGQFQAKDFVGFMPLLDKIKTLSREAIS